MAGCAFVGQICAALGKNCLPLWYWGEISSGGGKTPEERRGEACGDEKSWCRGKGKHRKCTGRSAPTCTAAGLFGVTKLTSDHCLNDLVLAARGLAKSARQLLLLS